MNLIFRDFLGTLKKNHLRLAVLFGAVVAFFIAVHILSHLGTDRRVFIFPVSGSSRTQREVRYLDSNPVQGKVACYVDELVLGPSVYRSRPIFTSGTKVEYCFSRGNVLYVGLSEEAALQEDGAVEISRAVSLLKKNISKNFAGIRSIELFIDGNFISDGK